MQAMDPTDGMPRRGDVPAEGAVAPGAERATGAALTAEEFGVRFQRAARVLWTIAAAVLGEPSEAEDVLQEACVMALGKLDRFDRDTNFTAWMGRFVRNVAQNHARKRRRRATRPSDPDVLAELAGDGGRFDGGSPVRGGGHDARPPIDGRGGLAPEQGAFDDRVLAGLRALAPVQSACLLLRTVLELSYREISRALEIPEGTAMSHVHRARVALRQALTEAPARDVSVLEEKPA